MTAWAAAQRRSGLSQREQRLRLAQFHAFPARFPPQLPREFVLALTDPGEMVLGSMAGSGITLVEAMLNGPRRGF